jgi:predicted DNA binding CopG/RHH family protein
MKKEKPLDEITKFFDEEERELYESIQKGGWKPVPKKEFEKTKKELQEAARYTIALRKSESISIRLTPIDLARIKEKAAEEGLPYQTLISSIIHKYAHGKQL